MKLPIHLFDWPSRHNVHLALPLLLLFSFVLHALGVVIFQIYYPRSSAAPFRSAQVYFLRPGSPEAQALAPMLAASDPALFSSTKPFGPSAMSVPGSDYLPDFEGEAPALQALPAGLEKPGQEMIPLLQRETSGSPSGTPLPGLRTVVKLRGGLEGRKMTPPENFIFTAPTKPSLESVEFLMEVSAEGIPLHVMPLFPPGTSGVESVDREAVAYLLRSRFEPREGGEKSAWGYAKFHWGADVERTKEP